jgi:hypothetical protein
MAPRARDELLVFRHRKHLIYYLAEFKNMNLLGSFNTKIRALSMAVSHVVSSHAPFIFKQEVGITIYDIKFKPATGQYLAAAPPGRPCGEKPRLAVSRH